jgi:hypothetical protein
VKTSFDNSTFVMGSSMESSSQKLGVPTNSRHWHRRKEEEAPHPCTQETTRAKLK